MRWSTKLYATFFSFFWLEKIKCTFSYALLPKFFLEFFGKKFTCWQKINFKNEVKKTSQPYREKKRIIALASRAQIVCFPLLFFFFALSFVSFGFQHLLIFHSKAFSSTKIGRKENFFPVEKRQKFWVFQMFIVFWHTLWMNGQNSWFFLWFTKPNFVFFLPKNAFFPDFFQNFFVLCW